MKGVFDIRIDANYDDDVRTRYHFGSEAYLRVAEECNQDWIIFRESRRGGGREGYVGVAFIQEIIQDPNDEGKYYAIIRDYIDFANVVPLVGAGVPYEDFLSDVAPALRGRTIQNHSLRRVSLENFISIVEAGNPDLAGMPILEALGDIAAQNPQEEQEDPLNRQGGDRGERRVKQALINKLLRDAAFRKMVVNAYDNRCAVTGLILIDHKGYAEVQGAHILPVADNGPDTIENGIALSATAHWLFDRHLISLSDDYRLLIANRVPHEMRAFLKPAGDIIFLPQDENQYPDVDYIRLHREKFNLKNNIE